MSLCDAALAAQIVPVRVEPDVSLMVPYERLYCVQGVTP